jgi:hypothetical protein
VPRLARGEYLDPHEVQVVHAIQRCVRRAFLCGNDPFSGQSYEHRRHWIRTRLEFLASVFAIDCLTYTVLSNHLHVVLRSRPDIVQTWSDEDVARRWLRLFPKRKCKDGSPEIPNNAELQMITGDPKRVEELRSRLSDLSWWMRCTAENIARQANREDECTGRFWEGRFRAQLLLDEASLLACVAYVDLNPIRAALAETLETSEFTGAKDRIDDLQERAGGAGNTHAWERSRRRRKSGWMSPLEIDERLDPVGPDPNPTSRRASQKGFLPISLAGYLELLDWTGRQLRATKRGVIPLHLAPILTRLGLDSDDWCHLVGKFGRVFKRVAGTTESLQAEATRRGQQFMHAPGRRLLSPAA